MEREKDIHETACAALHIVANNNMHFYRMADRKAQILIGANAIMISVLLSTAIQPSEFHRLAMIPITGQLLSCFLVIILSLHSSQPGSAPPRPTEERTVDLLHFLAYDRMDKDHYMNDLKETLENADRLYATLTRDIYFQSKVLARKYRYLTLAFNVFLIGLGVNVLATIIITV